MNAKLTVFFIFMFAGNSDGMVLCYGKFVSLVFIEPENELSGEIIGCELLLTLHFGRHFWCSLPFPSSRLVLCK